MLLFKTFQILAYNICVDQHCTTVTTTPWTGSISFGLGGDCCLFAYFSNASEMVNDSRFLCPLVHHSTKKPVALLLLSSSCLNRLISRLLRSKLFHKESFHTSLIAPWFIQSLVEFCWFKILETQNLGFRMGNSTTCTLKSKDFLQFMTCMTSAIFQAALLLQNVIVKVRHDTGRNMQLQHGVQKHFWNNIFIWIF